jgi:glycosyltransferase involved in cell wall biosynthesis
MKKVLIINNNLCTGGVQKALTNLLISISDEYDIDLFLLRNEGQYINDIPSNVNIINTPKFMRILDLSQAESKKLGKSYYLLRGGLALFTRIFNNKIPIKFMCYILGNIGEYDTVISYMQPRPIKQFYGGTNEIALKCTKAKQKVSFVHCDFKNYGGNCEYNRKLYTKFDKIVTVSDGCRNAIVSEIPIISNKTLTIKNFQNFSDITKQANSEDVIYEKGYFNLVTVARIAKEKGLDRTLLVIKRLINEEFKIKWHIIGDGEDWDRINRIIDELNLREYVKCYGNKANPYPYIKSADLFLLPSYHEAAPMVFEEAKCIGVPILSTETISAKELVELDGSGIVCGNDEEELYKNLRYILNNTKLIEELKIGLLSKSFNNNNSFEKFKTLISKDR